MVETDWGTLGRMVPVFDFPKVHIVAQRERERVVNIDLHPCYAIGFLIQKKCTLDKAYIPRRHHLWLAGDLDDPLYTEARM